LIEKWRIVNGLTDRKPANATPVSNSPFALPMLAGKSASWFARFAKSTAEASGHPAVFFVAAGIILAWAISGPLFGFSDTWQLVINTGTTIVTFLMVFLIQNTQNRDAHAVQVKLDELIRAIDGAHNALLDLEELDDDEIGKIRRHYTRLAEDARKALAAGEPDTGNPDIQKAGGQARKKL
jgi:low affinity Fe/Cu permease